MTNLAPTSPPELSLVIPAFNEAENLGPLLAELALALAQCGKTWEIILVDDGSGDGSGVLLAAAAEREPRLRPVLLTERVGQSGALVAGLALARGAVVVTLDADLQNDPADLGRVLRALEGADVVSGVRQDRHDRWIRRVSSWIANSVRRMVLGDPLTDIGCSFKAYRREALSDLPAFVGLHRFLPALCWFRGARVVEIPLAHRPRRFGVSKYGVGDRLWRGVYDLVGVRWLRSRMIRYRVREIDR